MKEFVDVLMSLGQFLIIISLPSFILLLLFKIIDICSYKKITFVNNSIKIIHLLSCIFIIVLSFMLAITIPVFACILDGNFIIIPIITTPLIAILAIFSLKWFDKASIKLDIKNQNVPEKLMLVSLCTYLSFAFLGVIIFFYRMIHAEFRLLGTGPSKEEQRSTIISGIAYLLSFITAIVAKILLNKRIVATTILALFKTQDSKKK